MSSNSTTFCCAVAPSVKARSIAEGLQDFNANSPSGWRVHRLSGYRDDEWSVSVSGNWRLTFVAAGGRIHRLNLEDYR